MKARNQYLVLGCVILAGLFVCVMTGSYAYKTNGSFGFPLDDPWIHLQFAKNLHDYGSFSYYKSEMVTSGSTSPLYTILLAGGFFFSQNEMILSYTFGVLFLLMAGFYLFKVSMKMFSDNIFLSALGSLLLFLEPRIVWISLSGMETTLFIALLLASLYYYLVKNTVVLGITAGLLIWTRPEAILFLLVLAADTVYQHYVVKRAQTKKRSEISFTEKAVWLKKAIYVTVGFGVLYVAFNYYLSGSIFPNTYAAKMKYYSGGGEDFPSQVFHFLSDGHLIVLATLVGIAIISFLFALIKRQQSKIFIPLLWSVGLFLAYWKNLPYLYQEGRYMMPVLPFVIILGILGIEILFIWLKKNILKTMSDRTSQFATVIILFVAVVQFGMASWDKRLGYAEYCKYISDRQVRTAHWLHDNLPENAIIATHDIGAIAYYSGRKIADMVGLVSPEMISNIGSYSKLSQFLILKKVTHLAVLRNWFTVANVNPIYQTDIQHPEIMEVFQYNQARVHFASREAERMTATAEYYLSQGNIQQAGPLLQQSLRTDPQYSKTHCLLANAYLAAGVTDKAETEVKTALQLHPDYWDALLSLAQVEMKQNKQKEAIARLEGIVQRNPDYIQSYRALAQIYQSSLPDSAKASYYRQRYNERIPASVQ